MEEQKKENQDPRPAPTQHDGNDATQIQATETKKERPEVIVVRNWREYLGESMLIVFSVLLALGLTEWFTKLHEEAQTRQILHQLREELIHNKEALKDQYQYHQKIMRRLDS